MFIYRYKQTNIRKTYTLTIEYKYYKMNQMLVMNQILTEIT